MSTWKIGDKLRIRSGPLSGRRAKVSSFKQNLKITVELEDGSRNIIPTSAATNFSAAARKAWKTMPARKVGRPVGSKISDRVSVTLRIDRRLWESFRMREERGLIADRSAAIEEALADIVSRLGGK